MNKDLILSFGEFDRLSSEIKNKVPYIYELHKQDQFLYCFGSKHVMDPNHPQFSFLHKKWVGFLENKSVKGTVVIYEGAVDEKNLVTIEEAIRKHGESGAIVFWAKQSRVENVRPEPTTQDDASNLIKQFSKEEVFYFYMLRGIATRRYKLEAGDFNEYISKTIARYRDTFGWENFDFSFETVLFLHQKLFHREFDVNDMDFLRKISVPVGNFSIVNDIARASSNNRNLCILKNIEKFWSEGKNIFIVYGASHMIMLERALRNMVGK